MKSVVALVLIFTSSFAIPATNYQLNTNSESLSYSLHPRIFRGQYASPGYFPHMVALFSEYISSQGLKFGTFCGASIISNKFLLTAAHCVTGDPVGLKVYLGAYDISTKSEPGRIEIRIPKENIISHEGYDWSLNSNDIAVIELPQKINFTRTIQPIKLPRRDQVNLEDQISIVTGWGATGFNSDNPNVLLYAQLKIRSDDFCRRFYGKHYHSSNICFDGSQQSPCSGDSGGPAMITEKDRSFTQIGVTSYGNRNGCHLGYPVAYTRVSSFLDWIHKHTGIPIRE